MENQKGKLFQKKFDALGKATHNPATFRNLWGRGPAGRLTQTRKNTHKPISELSSCSANAMRYKTNLLVSSASQQPPTTRQSVTTWWHRVITVWPETQLGASHTKPGGTGPSSHKRIHHFLWAFTIVFTMVFTMIVPLFFTCFTMVFTMFFTFSKVWYRFYGFSWQTHMKIVIWCFELVLRMFMLIMFIDLIWFDHLGMEIQKYVNNSQYLTVHRGVQHVW